MHDGGGGGGGDSGGGFSGGGHHGGGDFGGFSGHHHGGGAFGGHHHHNHNPGPGGLLDPGNAGPSGYRHRGRGRVSAVRVVSRLVTFAIFCYILYIFFHAAHASG